MLEVDLLDILNTLSVYAQLHHGAFLHILAIFIIHISVNTCISNYGFDSPSHHSPCSSEGIPSYAIIASDTATYSSLKHVHTNSQSLEHVSSNPRCKCLSTFPIPTVGTQQRAHQNEQVRLTNHIYPPNRPHNTPPSPPPPQPSSPPKPLKPSPSKPSPPT